MGGGVCDHETAISRVRTEMNFTKIKNVFNCVNFIFYLEYFTHFLILAYFFTFLKLISYII